MATRASFTQSVDLCGENTRGGTTAGFGGTHSYTRVREKAAVVCWQAFKKQIAATEDRRPKSDELGELVRPSQRELAQFLDRYEWLGTFGMARWRFGLRQMGELAAVVGFGPPGSHNAFRAILPTELAVHIVQLVR
jgi:hypothetical protein